MKVPDGLPLEEAPRVVESPPKRSQSARSVVQSASKPNKNAEKTHSSKAIRMPKRTQSAKHLSINTKHSTENNAKQESNPPSRSSPKRSQSARGLLFSKSGGKSPVPNPFAIRRPKRSQSARDLLDDSSDEEDNTKPSLSKTPSLSRLAASPKRSLSAKNLFAAPPTQGGRKAPSRTLSRSNSGINKNKPARTLSGGLFALAGPTRQRSKRQGSADRRDQRYLNILSTEGLVSTDNILETIELAQENTAITKLEFEDLLIRQEDQEMVFELIGDIFEQDQSRYWESIQIVDSLRIYADDMDCVESYTAMGQKLVDYEKKQKELYKLITGNRNGQVGNWQPVSFCAQVIVEQGTPIGAVLELLNKLAHGSNLKSVEFGGGLFGCEEDALAKGLGRLFEKDDQNVRVLLLREMITLALVYLPRTERRKGPLGVLLDCIEKLTKAQEKWALEASYF